jgi:dephospho-CoA kinase
VKSNFYCLTMIKVGLTGNMGTGKSTVARIFMAMGVPVYHADLEAKKFLFEQEVVSQLRLWWGEAVMTNGQPDRKKLATIVFKQPEKLKMLNSLIHPRVRGDLQEWLIRQHHHHYVIHEAAILFESGFFKEFDKIITVVCPERLAMKRIMERDGLEEEEIWQRMQNQWSQQVKIAKSDFHIVNDGNTMVIPQVLRIHSRLNRINKG